jgi:hypothetical protein
MNSDPNLTQFECSCILLFRQKFDAEELEAVKEEFRDEGTLKDDEIAPQVGT